MKKSKMSKIRRQKKSIAKAYKQSRKAWRKKYIKTLKKQIKERKEVKEQKNQLLCQEFEKYTKLAHAIVCGKIHTVKAIDFSSLINISMTREDIHQEALTYLWEALQKYGKRPKHSKYKSVPLASKITFITKYIYNRLLNLVRYANSKSRQGCCVELKDNDKRFVVECNEVEEMV
jgi:signal recognition particle GTPase